MTAAATAAAQRRAVVAEARAWIGTPYHEQADVLGVGVDCGMILIRVFVAAGLIADFDPRPYPRDWMMHRDDERYVEIVRGLAAHEFDPAEATPQPGDVVVWKHGRTFSHGAIVTAWPVVVHALADAGRVIEEDVSRSPLMRFGGGPRPMRGFSAWPAGV